MGRAALSLAASAENWLCLLFIVCGLPVSERCRVTCGCRNRCHLCLTGWLEWSPHLHAIFRDGQLETAPPHPSEEGQVFGLSFLLVGAASNAFRRTWFAIAVDRGGTGR